MQLHSVRQFQWYIKFKKDEFHRRFQSKTDPAAQFALYFLHTLHSSKNPHLTLQFSAKSYFTHLFQYALVFTPQFLQAFSDNVKRSRVNSIDSDSEYHRSGTSTPTLDTNPQMQVRKLVSQRFEIE